MSSNWIQDTCFAAKNRSSIGILTKKWKTLFKRSDAAADCRQTLWEVSEGHSPPISIPKLTTCASASETLPRKVSLPFSPAVPKAQEKTVSVEKIALASFFDALMQRSCGMVSRAESGGSAAWRGKMAHRANNRRLCQRPPVPGTMEPLILRRSIPESAFGAFVCYDAAIIPKIDEQNMTIVVRKGEFAFDFPCPACYNRII